MKPHCAQTLFSFASGITMRAWSSAPHIGRAHAARKLMLDFVIRFDRGFFHIGYAVKRRTNASPISMIIAVTTIKVSNDCRRSIVGRAISTSDGDGLRCPPVADARCSRSP